MNITYQVKGTNNYLVITPPEGSRIIHYLAKMAENNSIPGSLPMFSQVIDGNTKFFYEITGKNSFSSFVATYPLAVKEGEKILTSFIDYFLSLDRYFMSPAQCILKGEMAFINDNYNAYLPYYPVEETSKDVDKLLKEFFLEILGSYLIRKNGEEYYDNLLRFLVRPGFNLEKFREMVVTDKTVDEQIKTDSDGEQVKNSDELLPRDVNKKVKDKKERHEKKKTSNDNNSNGSIALPGGETFKIPKVIDGEDSSKEKKVQDDKRKGLFGLTFRKKVKNLDMDVEENIKTADKSPTVKPAGHLWKGTVKIDGKTNKTVVLEEGGQGSQTAHLSYQGREIPINSMEFKIGRTMGELLINCEYISGHHATITMAEDKYYIMDNNSGNHTYINGTVIAPFTPTELHDGDAISLAKEEMVFHINH